MLPSIVWKFGENEFIVSFEMVVLPLKCENPLKIKSLRRFSATDFEFGTLYIYDVVSNKVSPILDQNKFLIRKTAPVQFLKVLFLSTP